MSKGSGKGPGPSGDSGGGGRVRDNGPTSSGDVKKARHPRIRTSKFKRPKKVKDE